MTEVHLPPECDDDRVKQVPVVCDVGPGPQAQQLGGELKHKDDRERGVGGVEALRQPGGRFWGMGASQGRAMLRQDQAQVSCMRNCQLAVTNMTAARAGTATAPAPVRSRVAHAVVLYCEHDGVGQDRHQEQAVVGARLHQQPHAVLATQPQALERCREGVSVPQRAGNR